MSRRALYLALGLLLAPRVLPAQGVLVAPHAVFMDHRTRGGAVTLFNPGNDPVEVSIGLLFGYPVTDSAGEYMLRTVETPDSTLPSAAGWIRAFPRRLVLGPRERKTVRLLGQPPAGLPDGEYWARLAVQAKAGQVPVQNLGDTTGITVGLSLEVRTVIPVSYRKGSVTSGVAISRLEARIEGDSLVARARLERTGDAAYLGTARGTLVDSTGKVVASFEEPVSVYFDVAPRFTAPLARTGPAPYRFRLEVTAEREDLSPDQLLRSAPARDSLVLANP